GWDSSSGERLFVVAQIVVAGGIGARRRRGREAAAQREHRADAIEVERALAGETALREKLRVAALGIARIDAEPLLEELQRLAAVCRRVEPVERGEVRADVTHERIAVLAR